MSVAELARLTQSYLNDGVRGLDRTQKASRDPTLPARIISLFHNDAAAAVAEPPFGVRRLVPVHSRPAVYVVPNFLSPRELDHFDELITSRRAAFKTSHTDGTKGAVVSEERTSISLPLPKSGDSVLRSIEARAAELVGLPSDYVEPLQVVHYSHGARFDTHHDIAPIHVAGEAESVDGADAGGPGADARWSEETVSVEPVVGPRRLVTLFVYLNTLPEGVGHTEFPMLKTADGTPFSMRPRSGHALVFCNVTANGEPDVRLCHRACPVGEGHVKFGVNIWVSDVSQQAHVLAAPPTRGGKGRGGGASRRGGILAPHLFVDPADLPPPPSAAILGLEVRREFGSHGVFAGRVTSYCPRNGYRLEYEDGDEEDVAPDDVLALPLARPDSVVGRRVSKYFVGHGRFDGEVVGFHPKRGYEVHYQDGDQECLASAELLRLLQPPSCGKRKPPQKARAATAASGVAGGSLGHGGRKRAKNGAHGRG